MSHRLKRARELAGLSLEQASRLDFHVAAAEHDDVLSEDILARAKRLYDASRCWLLGHDDQRIPAIVVKALDDSKATGKDRDILVEVLASLSSCQACKI